MPETDTTREQRSTDNTTLRQGVVALDATAVVPQQTPAAFQESPGGPHHDPPREQTPGMIRPLGLTLVTACIGLFAFEWIKEWLLPDITKWHSHYITIIVGTMIACIGSAIALRKLQRLHAQVHTVRQQAAETVRARDQRFRTLIEGSLQGVLIHRENHALFVNQAYADIFGYASPDAILALDTLVALIAPHERERLMGYHEARLAGKTAPSHYAYQGLRKDGALVWLDMTVRLVTWDGQPATQSIVVDITERKRAEEHLQFQAQLLDSVQESVVATDLEGHVTYWGKGAEALYGYRAEEVLGTPITFIVDSQEEHEEEQQRMRTVAETGLWRGQYVQQRKDGSQFWADTVITLVTDPQGQPCGFVGIDRDLTVQKHTEAARQHLEAQLRQAHKMEALGTLAGGIAHEFNNILGAILGFTDLTLSEVPQGSRAWSNLQEVLTAGHRAKDLVQQILAFSRQSEHAREPLSVSRVVHEALTLLRATLPTTIEICQHLSEAEDMVLANRTQLHQVVLNLCTNAEQAMRETGGVLEIGVDHVEGDAAGAAPHPDLPPGPYVRVWIRDAGPGMPPEVMEHIFEPFYTTKGVGEGTGMGLAIVYGIVTSHGGTITVQSTPGDGSVFTIYLPQREAMRHSCKKLHLLYIQAQ